MYIYLGFCDEFTCEFSVVMGSRSYQLYICDNLVSCLKMGNA